MPTEAQQRADNHPGCGSVGCTRPAQTRGYCSKPQLIDLLAHMRTAYDDASRAHRDVLLVLDLGWRPTVGVS